MTKELKDAIQKLIPTILFETIDVAANKIEVCLYDVGVDHGLEYKRGFYSPGDGSGGMLMLAEFSGGEPTSEQAYFIQLTYDADQGELSADVWPALEISPLVVKEV